MTTLTRDTRMTRRLIRPESPAYIRLELDQSVIPAVEDAAHKCRLSLASFSRLAIEMLAANGKTTVEDVRREADRRLAKEKK